MKKANKRDKFWSFRNDTSTGSGQLYLYGIIESESWWGDEITPKQFQSDLAALGDISQLDVFINSDGGDVFAGQAIHSMLKRHPANVTVYIDGLAASIASVIAMAGDKVVMPRNAMMMVHNPWCWGMGNSQDFRSLADELDKIRESLIAAYQDKSGMSVDDITSLLDAETWLTAEEAVSHGLADEIEQSKQVAASLRNGKLIVNGREMDLSRYQHAPKFAAAESDGINHVCCTDCGGNGISDGQNCDTCCGTGECVCCPECGGNGISHGNTCEMCGGTGGCNCCPDCGGNGVSEGHNCETCGGTGICNELSPGTEPNSHNMTMSNGLSTFERRIKNNERRLIK